MSFSLDVKTDLLQLNSEDELMDKLELESMIRISGEIGIVPVKISLTSQNNGIIRRFISLVKKYYNVETEILVRMIDRFESHKTYTVEIIDGAKGIIDDLNLFNDASKNKLLINITNSGAYLRGAFLMRGSVNSPNARSYHLEISSSNETEILFLQQLMNLYELNARITRRKSLLVLYIKSISSITDFLYIIGCKKIMDEYHDMIIKKEIKTNAKRSINLEVANQSKTNDSSKEQLKYIKYLKFNYPLENIDNKLLMVMKVREEYPEYSLSELLDVIHSEYDPKLSKSGLNHRFRKIKEIAIEHKNNKVG